MEIRRATAEDAAQIAALWHVGWHQAHAAIVSSALVASRTLAEFAQRVPPRLPQTYLCCVSDTLAGFFMLDGDELYQFYVADGFHGQGIAAQMMVQVEKTLAPGLAWLACSVGNARAARFYEKCGWRRVGIETYAVETLKGSLPVEIWRYEKALAALN